MFKLISNKEYEQLLDYKFLLEDTAKKVIYNSNNVNYNNILTAEEDISKFFYIKLLDRVKTYLDNSNNKSLNSDDKLTFADDIMSIGRLNMDFKMMCNSIKNQ